MEDVFKHENVMFQTSYDRKMKTKVSVYRESFIINGAL